MQSSSIDAFAGPVGDLPDAARVLLVDDRPANLLALEAVLAPLNLTLVSVRSGAESLAELERGDFAVVLLDVQMPGMDGFQTALGMQELTQATARKVPIIFVTALDTDRSRIAGGYALGAVDFIQKPFDPDVLRAKVTIFVELHVAKQRLAVERETARLRLKALTDLGLGLSQARTRAQVAGVIVEHGMRLARADICTLHLLDAGGDGLDLIGERGVAPRVLDRIRRITDASRNPATHAAIRSRLPTWAEGEAQYEALYPDLATLPTAERRAKAFWCVPLVVEDRAIGVLGMGFYEPRAFPPEERTFASTFAKQCAQALQRALLVDLEEETRRSEKRDAARRDFLAAAGEALVSSLDYRGTLATVARLAVPHLADWCAVDVLEPGANVIQQLALAHADPNKIELARQLRERYPPDPNAPTGVPEVIRSGKAELYAAIDAERVAAGARDGEHAAALRALKLESAMVVPLRAHDRTFGAMTFIYAGSGRNYAATDLAFVEDFARRAAMAIENARALKDAQDAREAERKARQRIGRMQEITAALSRARSAADVAEAVSEIGARAIDAINGALWTLRDDGSLDLAGSWGRPDSVAEEYKVIAADAKGVPALDVAHSGEPCWIETADDLRRAAPEILPRLEASGRVTSYAMVPLVGEGRVEGVLAFAHPVGHRYDDDERAFFVTLALHCSQAFHRARLLDTAQDALRRAEDEARRAEDERRRAESANRSKDEFLATVSHELRTPLNAINGWAVLLADRLDDRASIAKGIAVIHRNAQAQAKIIEDILDVSRIVTGKLKIDVGPADMVAIARDALEVVRPAADARQVKLTLAAAPAASPLAADAGRLQQALWNLLSNAIKFTSAGGEVTVAIEDDGTTVVVTVSDTGRGIEAAFLPYVFERFRQADSSSTRKFGGLGLGLALVRHIVELHGGRVSVTSAGAGQGSSFTISVPVRAAAVATPVPADRPSQRASFARATQAAGLSGMRILVVDDEVDARELLETALTAEGAVVQTAGSVKEALARLDALQADLLLSDIGMPEEDGYALIRRVRAKGASDGGAMPAIALTAYARAEDRARALAAGYTEYLTKPLDVDELVKIVRAIDARRIERPA